MRRRPAFSRNCPPAPVLHLGCHPSGGTAMATCVTCGNDYEKAFKVTAAGRDYVVDSLECAIHALAPICSHCGCRVVGHGVEKDGTIFCCVHCASHQGVAGMKDRV